MKKNPQNWNLLFFGITKKVFHKVKTRFLLQKSPLCLLECTTFSSFGMFTNCVRSNCDHLYHAIFLDLTFEKSKEPNKNRQSDVKRPTFEKKAQSNVYFVGASCKQNIRFMKILFRKFWSWTLCTWILCLIVYAEVLAMQSL